MSVKSIDKTTQFYVQLYKGIENGLKQSSKFINNRIKDITPVRTGFLKQNMIVDIIPYNAKIRNDVYYAPFVELGTIKMSPRAMMRRGFDTSIRGAETTFINELVKQLEKL